MTKQAYQSLPNIVTEQIAIETKTSVHLIPVTADKKGIDEINRALEIAKKEHERLEKVEELLELYREHINNLCKQEREGVEDSMFSSEFMAYKLYEQIKILEKELEEQK